MGFRARKRSTVALDIRQVVLTLGSYNPAAPIPLVSLVEKDVTWTSTAVINANITLQEFEVWEQRLQRKNIQL